MNTAPLVLLHGWGLSARVWSGLTAALPPGQVVHALDLPGHGSAERAYDASLRGWADRLLDAMPHDAVLCGWSLGGLIALELALRHPERFSRLILFGASPCFVAHGSHGLPRATVQAFIDGFAAEPAATLRRFIALQTLGDARRRAVGAALSAAVSDFAGERHRALADGLELLARSDLRPRLAALRLPATLVHGAADALMPATGARWLARQWPQAHLTLFDDCGHAPFLSRPVECAALIMRDIKDA
jgi:pimeloyl-[acyl-carrier protein] methyl ester esterase